MEERERRHRLAQLIDAVLSEHMSAADAYATAGAWPDAPWSDRAFNDAAHALVHYRDDEDIRAKDERYRIWQREWLAAFARRLRAGESYTPTDSR